MSTKRPYSVPEGYFDNLQMRLSAIPQQSEVSTVPASRVRFAPYLALAACFMFAFIVGSVLIKRPVGIDYVEYEQMLQADIIPYTYPYGVYEGEDSSSEDGLTDQDLIEYLIATNTSADLIAYETNK